MKSLCKPCGIAFSGPYSDEKLELHMEEEHNG